MDAAERQSLAESLELAARGLDAGTDRFIIDEHLRTAIASQPASGRWAKEIDRLLQTAHSPSPIVYANNLRKIAKGLRAADSSRGAFPPNFFNFS